MPDGWPIVDVSMVGSTVARGFFQMPKNRVSAGSVGRVIR